MSPVVVARFPDVWEAELACSLLRSAGIDARLGEGAHAKVDPLIQQAVGWIRILAPADEADDAREILARAAAGEFAGDDPDDQPDRELGGPMRAAAMFGVLLNPMIALGVMAGRRPPSIQRTIGFVLLLLFVVLAVWLLLSGAPWFLQS